jgi:hypothetical protein
VIDIKRVLTYCKNLNIQFEDFLFLYTLRVRSENRKDEDFFELTNWYYQNFQYIMIGDKVVPVNWKLRVEKLIEQGFIEAYPNWFSKKKNNELLVDIHLSKLELTEKFNENLFTNDLEDWWSEFIYIYSPNYYTVNKDGNRGSIEDVKRKFWEISNYGDKGKLMKMLEITKYYVDTTQLKLAVSNFLDEFSERERLYDNWVKTTYKPKREVY